MKLLLTPILFLLFTWSAFAQPNCVGADWNCDFLSAATTAEALAVLGGGGGGDTNLFMLKINGVAQGETFTINADLFGINSPNAEFNGNLFTLTGDLLMGDQAGLRLSTATSLTNLSSAGEAEIRFDGTNILASTNGQAFGAVVVLTPNKGLAHGVSAVASGQYSYAGGSQVTASGLASHAEGTDTDATEEYAHAEGDATLASGAASHAEGYSTQATGAQSHAEGSETVASGIASHAEGVQTQAAGESSHAEGTDTHATGDISHAAGHHAYASGLVSWLWNGSSTENKTNSVARSFMVNAPGGIKLDGAVNASRILSSNITVISNISFGVWTFYTNTANNSLFASNQFGIATFNTNGGMTFTGPVTNVGLSITGSGGLSNANWTAPRLITSSSAGGTVRAIAQDDALTSSNALRSITDESGDGTGVFITSSGSTPTNFTFRGTNLFSGQTVATNFIAYVDLSTKTANFTLTATNSIIHSDATGGSLTNTLPAPNSTDAFLVTPNGARCARIFTVMKSDSGGNTVVTVVSGGANINGTAQRTLSSQYQTEKYYSNGSQYFVQ